MLKKEQIMPSVESIAAGFAAYEESIRAMKQTVADLRELAEGLHKQGLVGYLEYQDTVAQAEAMIASHEWATYAMHRALTTRARDLGIDLPAPRSGGDR